MAETELEAYLEGEFPMEKQNIEDAIKVQTARLNTFRSELARAERLYEAQNIPESDLSAARNNVSQSESKLESHRQKLVLLEKFTRRKEVILRESNIAKCKAQINGDQIKLASVKQRLQDLRQRRSKLTGEQNSDGNLGKK